MVPDTVVSVGDRTSPKPFKVPVFKVDTEVSYCEEDIKYRAKVLQYYESREMYRVSYWKASTQEVLGEKEISACMLKQDMEDTPEYKIEKRNLMICSFSILFVRYNMATFLSAFFPEYADDHGISDTASGIIFAAYPIGMFLTSLFATRAIVKVGLRKSIVLGMILNAVCILLFGLTPSWIGASACLDNGSSSGSCITLQGGFFLFYFLAGLLGSTADIGCYMALQNWNQKERASIVAAGSMACGIGCMVGPELGGLVYDIGDQTPFGAFFFPFFLFFVVCCFCVIILYWFPASAKISDDKPTSVSKMFTASFALTWIGYALNGTFVATLDPTLETKLSESPFHASSTVVGLIFMQSSVIYTLITYPIGWICDKYLAGNGRLLKWALAFGFVNLGFCFVLMGPFKLGGLDLGALDGWVAVNVAMIFKGVGSAFGAVAYADMAIGIPDDDELLHATVVALNNASYAIGWGIGPIVGGFLLDAFSGSDSEKFAGFSTSIAIASFVYAAVLFIAPLLGLAATAAPGGGEGSNEAAAYEPVSHEVQRH